MIGIGPKSRVILEEVGICDVETLRLVGVEEAFRRAKAHTPGITLNFLWGLEAAASQTHWLEIPEDRKRELKRLLVDLLR